MGKIRYYADMTPEEVAEAEAQSAAQAARKAKAGKPPGCPTCELPTFGVAGACMACGELWPDLVEARAEIEKLRAEVAAQLACHATYRDDAAAKIARLEKKLAECRAWIGSQAASCEYMVLPCARSCWAECARRRAHALSDEDEEGK